jgi:hypothetical protein
VDTLTSGSSGLRYDPIDNQYVYTWRTDKSMGGYCYTLILTLYQFDVHRAHFQMK